MCKLRVVTQDVKNSLITIAVLSNTCFGGISKMPKLSIDMCLLVSCNLKGQNIEKLKKKFVCTFQKVSQ